MEVSKTSKITGIKWVWSGGHGIHGYLGGKEVAFFNVGNFAKEALSEEEAKQALERIANASAEEQASYGEGDAIYARDSATPSKEFKRDLVLERLRGVFLDLDLAYEHLKERQKRSILETYHFLQVAQVNALGASSQCDGICGEDAPAIKSMAKAIKRNADELGDLLYETKLTGSAIEEFMKRIQATKKLVIEIIGKISHG